MCKYTEKFQRLSNPSIAILLSGLVIIKLKQASFAKCFSIYNRLLFGFKTVIYHSLIDNC